MVIVHRLLSVVQLGYRIVSWKSSESSSEICNMERTFQHFNWKTWNFSNRKLQDWKHLQSFTSFPFCSSNLLLISSELDFFLELDLVSKRLKKSLKNIHLTEDLSIGPSWLKTEQLRNCTLHSCGRILRFQVRANLLIGKHLNFLP